MVILFALLALILGLLEIFILPGFGIAGIGAIACAVIDAVFIYDAYGLTWTIVAIVVTLLVLALVLYYVAHSKMVDKASLQATISSTNATTAQLSVRVGDKGKALTRLALVGNALIEGKTVEVKSSGAFIDAGTPVVVTHVSEALIVVETIN